MDYEEESYDHGGFFEPHEKVWCEYCDSTTAWMHWRYREGISNGVQMAAKVCPACSGGHQVESLLESNGREL